MTQKFIQLFTVGLLFLLSTTAVLSQQRISSPVGPPENWVRPFEGFRIIGNLYGVGSEIRYPIILSNTLLAC